MCRSQNANNMAFNKFLFSFVHPHIAVRSIYLNCIEQKLFFHWNSLGSVCVCVCVWYRMKKKKKQLNCLGGNGNSDDKRWMKEFGFVDSNGLDHKESSSLTLLHWIACITWHWMTIVHINTVFCLYTVNLLKFIRFWKDVQFHQDFVSISSNPQHQQRFATGCVPSFLSMIQHELRQTCLCFDFIFIVSNYTPPPVRAISIDKVL